jgi:alanine racemase
MVDATDIEDVQFGDRITLAGEEDGVRVSIDELADLSGRFNYEFVCNIGKRVPREYVRNGRVIEQMDYFE